MLRIFFLATFLVSLIQLSNASAESAFRVGYVDFPPYSTRSSDGKPVGYMIDRAKKLFEKAGIREVQWVYLPPKRIYKSLMAGELDAFMGAPSSKGIHRFCYVSNDAVMSMSISLWSLDPAVKDVKDIEEVKDQSIGVVFGYTYGGLMESVEAEQKSSKRLEAKSSEDLISALYKKRIKYALNYDDPMNFFIVHTPLKDLYGKKLGSVDAHILVSKKANNSKAIFDLLQQSMKLLKQDPR